MADGKDDLQRLAEAIQLLKLYRRAELESSQGEDLIEKLYVDPLPNDHVHSLLCRPNTTFLIGRRGTGKSTVFLRAQKSLANNREVLSTYVDIKTVYEQSQIDPAVARNLARNEAALPESTLSELLLMTAFLKAVVAGVRDDIRKTLRSSWKKRVREAITGSFDDLNRSLDDFIAELENPQFVNVQGIRSPTSRTLNQDQTEHGQKLGVDINSTGPAAKFGVDRRSRHLAENEETYSDVLMRTFDLRKLISAFKGILEPAGVKHLFIFLDDFSELPQPAMESVVNVLVAPLNNWSDELVKFKIAAYPGRIHYGDLDKSKIDEVTLDLHALYGTASMSEMEDKAVDFVKRLVTKRLEHFELDVQEYIDSRSEEAVWSALFHASMGNPRTLGYILFFAYESRPLYGEVINVTSVRDAAKRYYEEKLEPYFSMGKFLYETFDEKSTIFSLKELLESIVDRARALRAKEAASVFRRIEGQHPTSHFIVSPKFDSILSTLELNFFLTKYYSMSNRDGHRVSVYALNYGLCSKYTIAFGRPSESRDLRLYLVERVFDYNPILQDYIANNQEIQCGDCGHVFEAEELPALRRFGMRCPECSSGICSVTNISRKYEDLIRAVNEEQLLPATELGILQALRSDPEPQYASTIAGELDVSYQLVGKRAKRLGEQRLVVRDEVKGRPEFKLTDEAERIYFSAASDGELTFAPVPAEEIDTSKD